MDTNCREKFTPNEVTKEEDVETQSFFDHLFPKGS